MDEQAIPKHLQHWPGLFEWRDGKVVEAPPEDIAIARNYPWFPDKGPFVSGICLTIMSRQLRYQREEPVRIIHVVEIIEPGRELYIMGPKLVYGEYIDDRLMTPPPPDDLWAPATYNGPILPSPAVDYNYEITTYRFEKVGTHKFQWRLGALHSNILTIDVFL